MQEKVARRQAKEAEEDGTDAVASVTIPARFAGKRVQFAVPAGKIKPEPK